MGDRYCSVDGERVCSISACPVAIVGSEQEASQRDFADAARTARRYLVSVASRGASMLPQEGQKGASPADKGGRLRGMYREPHAMRPRGPVTGSSQCRSIESSLRD